MKVDVWCKTCKCWHTIDDNTPLMAALPNHAWTNSYKKNYQGAKCEIVYKPSKKELWESDQEALAEREFCPQCGVPHVRNNPYTGCELS